MDSLSHHSNKKRSFGKGVLTTLYRKTKNLVSNNKKFDELFDAMLDNQYELTLHSKKFEERFMRVLGTLEDLENTSSILIEESDSLLEISNSKECPIETTSEFIAPYTNFIEGSGQYLKTAVSELRVDGIRIHETLSVESNLDRTFSQLSYLRTLFAVEAAAENHEVKDMFSSLVDEIHRLQKNVVKIFKEKFQALRDHQKTIDFMVREIGEQADSQFLELEMKRVESEKSFEGLSIEQKNLLQSNKDLNTASVQIDEAISKSIIALQTQDMVNQKIEHIFEIFEEILEHRETILKPKSKADKCHSLRFIENASKVIINQIHYIRTEIKTAEDAIASSLDFIRSSILNFEEDAASRQSTGNVRDDELNPINFLKSNLDDTAKIIKETEDITKLAFEKIEPIRGMASNVTETIIGLSAQLHLIGLNAEVHAARVGGSSGLETISSKTSSIALETKTLCQSLSEKLDSLVSSLNTNVGHFEELYNNSQSNKETLTKMVPLQKTSLDSYYQNYETSTQKIEIQVQKLISLINTSETKLDTDKAMDKQLQCIEDNLSALAVECKESADSIKVEVNVPQIMESLMSRYTMESEKKVHRSSLGLPPGTPFSITSEFPTTPKKDDVEFFDTNDFDRTDSTPEVNEPNVEENRLKELNIESDDNVEFF